MSASFNESESEGAFTLAGVEPTGEAILSLLSLLPLMFIVRARASAAFETASLIFSIALSLSMSKAKSIQSPVN